MIRKAQILRKGVLTDGTIKLLANREEFYPPARWQGGFRWVSKTSKGNCFLRNGFLYVVKRGAAHPTVETLRKVRPDAATHEELVPFYEAALCDSEEI